MSKEGNPTTNRAVATDPYADWTNNKRMEAFEETGNTSYLNIELARNMKLGVELIQQIPGVTEEDLIYAKERDVQIYKMYQKPFEERGLCSKHLESVLKQGVPKYLRHLMNSASMPVTENDLDIQEGEKNAAVYAHIAIEKFLLENAEAVCDLFDAIQLGSSKGIKDVQVIKRVYESVCSDYFYLSGKLHASEKMSPEEEKRLKKCESVLRWYTKMTEDYINNSEMSFKVNNSFLTDLYLYEFCQDSKYTRPNLAPEDKDATPLSVRTGDISIMRREVNLEKIADFDRDLLVPFEIEEGRMAIFGVGKNSIHIADREYTKEHLPIIEKLRSEIQYSIEGQDERQRVVARKPHQLHEVVWDLEDVGEQIREYMSGESEFLSDEQLRDYMFLLHADMREAIESYFHFSLKNLPIKEQIYFSTFLQDVTFGEVHLMKRFVLRHGALGMRTFLSLERGGEELGDLIIKFGTEHRELAEKVFAYYGQLLDSAEKAEELAEGITHCKLDECRDAKEKIRDNLINRAQKDLERALKANDTATIEMLVRTCDVKAKEYVALLQEVGEGNIEQKNPDELSPEDKTQMLSLLQANFDEAYKDTEDEEFKTAVKGSLERAFTNPNTVFRIIRDKGVIVSFNRFDTLTDHEGKEVTYFGSFNADPAYSGVGNVVLEKTTQERLQDGRPMMAHCDPKQPITKKYIESGFIATGFFELAGKPSFEIWRTEDMRSRFASKNETHEDLVSSLEKGKSDYDIRKQNEQETYPELEEGKALTRYFVHNGETYLVFEEVPEDLREGFVEPNA